MKKTSMLVLALTLAVAGSQDAFAKSKKEMKKEAETKAAQEAHMAEMTKRAAPGEPHKVLEALVGNWNVTAKMSMKPGDPMMESKGTSTGSMIYGGRFLKMEDHGSMGDKQYNAMSVVGYDNQEAKYHSFWVGDMSTTMTLTDGVYDPAAKTLTETGVYNDCMTGETNKPFRGVWYFTDANTNRYEMFGRGPDGKEIKIMEMTYSRAK